MPNLVSLTCPSLQILGKIQTGVLAISGVLVNLLKTKKNCLNLKTSKDIDMKLGPVTKLDKRNATTSKKDDDVMSINCDVVIFRISG